jgi:streptomycin 6-kinase
MVASVIGGILRSITDYPDVPRLDEQVRQRLVRRFGDGVQSWLEELPGRLLVLRERWSLELHAVIPRGSMSVVIRCRTPQGQRAVLKLSPDRARLVNETAGLAHWSTPHVPTVLRTDASTVRC